MVPIFKLLTLLNSENASKVSYNPLMVVFSMVWKEEFKCKANICLHFSFASNEKHANSAWLYNQKETWQDIIPLKYWKGSGCTCGHALEWRNGSRERKREVWKEERGIIYRNNYQNNSSHIINRALIISQDYFSGYKIAEYCYIVWKVRSHCCHHWQ